MASPGMWQSPARLYLDRTRSRVVPEDSPEAAFVLVGEHGEIPIAEATRLGLLDPPKPETVAKPETVIAPEPEPEPDDEPEAKAKPSSPNKARGPGEDK